MVRAFGFLQRSAQSDTCSRLSQINISKADQRLAYEPEWEETAVLVLIMTTRKNITIKIWYVVFAIRPSSS